jgi:diguanylate cyclase (GGDEF)-like protein
VGVSAVPGEWADLLFLVNQTLFVLMFLFTAHTAWRDRRRSEVDTALLFGVMATLLIVPRVAELAGVPSAGRQVLVTPLIIAVPYLMLRLVADFAAVPWWALRLAEAVFVGQIVAFLLSGSISLALVATYAAIPIGWSTFAFARGARRARGVAGRRYTAIAAGNAAAVASLALVAAAIPPDRDPLPIVKVVLQLFVLVVGAAYFCGFATPAWLRRLWREREMRAFLTDLSALLTVSDERELARQLAVRSSEAMGTDGALIGLTFGTGRLYFGGTEPDYDAPIDQTFGGLAMRAGQAIVSLDPTRDVPAQADLYRERNVRMLVAAPIRAGEETTGVLVVRSSHASLFATDDLETCQILADQAALVLRNRALRAEQEYRADHEDLTGLLTSSAMYRRIEECIAQDATVPVALLVLEMDDFDEIDQTFGHLVGDELLGQIARRVTAIAPATALLSRWSRDRFAILVPAEGLGGAEAFAGRILGSFERPFGVEHEEIECGLSIGIAVRPEHAADARDLVAAADVALGLAKRAANTYAVYPIESLPQLVHRTAMRGELRRAIVDGAVRVEYQPIVSLRTGEVLRLEALTRWPHPVRGAIPPSEFVDLAERSGLIRALTDRVLHQALNDAREWREWLPRVRVAVNLSARVFGDTGLVDRIVRELERTGCDPGGLALEITESTLMTEPERAHQMITRLRQLGITTEIDDFGTGYSSLAYLQRLPVSGIKIDRHFVAAMVRDERSDAIVRATIRLSHELGFEVVAEGIEDRAMWDLLAASGCDVGQGYYVARPMPALEFRGWYATWMGRVPLAYAAAEALRARRDAGGERPVLVVDDDPAIVSVVSDVLREYGYSVASASDGEEALELIDARRPRAILLDVHMPLLDGPALAQKMRGRGIDVPLVVMTAGTNARRWAERMGATAYLPKPFTVDQLTSVVRGATRVAGTTAN